MTKRPTPTAKQAILMIGFMRKSAKSLTDDLAWVETLGLVKAPPTERAETQGKGTTSDPTGEAVVGAFEQRTRARVKTAKRAVGDAYIAFIKAQNALAAILADYRLNAEDLEAGHYIGSAISKEEYEEALANQRKRLARGDGYGIS